MAQPLKTVTGLTEAPALEGKSTGLALLRVPFPDHQISKLPKGTRAQNECPNSEKRSCAVCRGWHHPQIIHLDYVGHAALTDRLLEADPEWSWEPMAVTPEGLPRFDAQGGLWIRLTVCGVTRLGYGCAEGKQRQDIGAREKEVIGDALRNAGIRFGCALDLWHKGDLHGGSAPGSVEPDNDTGSDTSNGVPADAPNGGRIGNGETSQPDPQGLARAYLARFGRCRSAVEVQALSDEIKANWGAVRGVRDYRAQVEQVRAKAFARFLKGGPVKATARNPGED